MCRHFVEKSHQESEAAMTDATRRDVMKLTVAAGAATLAGTAAQGQDAPLIAHQVHVLYDAQGNILSFAIPAGKYAGGIRSVHKPGHHVKIIERSVPPGPQGHQQITQELMNSRVKVGPNPHELVPKERVEPSPVPVRVVRPRDRHGRFVVPRSGPGTR
jgi:hypothetical protein